MKNKIAENNVEKKGLLKVTNDYIFKRIFGQVGNEDITADLLEKILHVKYESIDLSKNPIVEADVVDGKAGVLDVAIETDKNEFINVEMQVVEYDFMAERILEYWSKKYSQSFKKGDDYKVARRTIGILITCYEMKQLKEVEKIHTKWNIREEEYKDLILTDKLEFHIINLRNMERVNVGQDEELINWCKFIMSPESLEGKIMEENKNIEKAKKVLEEISQDEQEREMAYRRERAIRDQNAIKSFAYKQGIEEGREEGIKQGIKEGIKEGIEKGRIESKIDIAKNLLKQNVSIDIVMSATGLTEEEVKNLI